MFGAIVGFWVAWLARGWFERHVEKRRLREAVFKRVLDANFREVQEAAARLAALE